MNSKGVVHIVDPGRGPIEDKAELFTALDLEPRVYRSPLEFLRGFTHAKPCCLISAMRQPELPGLELLAQLQKQPTPPPVIIMTAYGDVKTAVQAMKLGAAEFLEIPVHDEVLLGVVQNWIRVDRVRRSKANKCAAVREKLAKLSAREREVLAGVLGGQSNKEMAAKLAISAKSIEVYRGKLMAKMEACSIPELVREVLCCPLSSCGPSDYGYLCTGSGMCANTQGTNATFGTIPEIHFSRLEYVPSKEEMNGIRG
jgi:two-component system response regulator FixJ